MATSTSALNLKNLWQPSVFWLTFAGAGLLRPAPGTWGSLAALAVWWLGLSDLPALVQLVLALTYGLVSWWVCARFLQRSQLHDEPQIVADEVAGLWLALAMVPAVWWLAGLVFAVFRVLDIVKPSIIGWCDRSLKGGLGVMADDLVAGLGAGLTGALIALFI
ncbi:MAG TPA: phosphatidylglycerophosphatase A [Gammaproteobacteria bacterium]|nr:phosphatidylglycerophosphatase A [Gammaproteobacteria bacterium]